LEKESFYTAFDVPKEVSAYNRKANQHQPCELLLVGFLSLFSKMEAAPE